LWENPEIPGSGKNVSKSEKSQPELPGFGWEREVTDLLWRSGAMSAPPLIEKPQD
jgi:hypothetical protein